MIYEHVYYEIQRENALKAIKLKAEKKSIKAYRRGELLSNYASMFIDPDKKSNDVELREIHKKRESLWSGRVRDYLEDGTYTSGPLMTRYSDGTISIEGKIDCPKGTFTG